MLSALDEERRRAVLKAMDVIQGVLGGGTPPEASKRVRADVGEGVGSEAGVGRVSKPSASTKLILRTHRPGDMGWVVQRHGEIYHQEYGWNEEFEALVAGIVAEFVNKLDLARERCWIAERDGQRIGCIFLVAKDRVTAKLRLLLVDPAARGLGVGRRLVTECVRFARQAGYQKIVLWTQRNLSAARHLYREAGFELAAEEPHHSFGHDLVGETWELELRDGAGGESSAKTKPRRG
jgi:GNAT superfamily N-acetyltransferase